ATRLGACPAPPAAAGSDRPWRPAPAPARRSARPSAGAPRSSAAGPAAGPAACRRSSARPWASLDVPFPSSREATIALRSLSPDREPRRGGISKHLSVSGSTLSVRWSADEARILRVSVNSFLDHLSLVIETMEMFGPPVAL
uniref:L antigen family member 3 n=1 Tax=Kryptolebias marmoratus TaxID=37003 RepID=A0A3Q3A5R7_KRYMA